MNRTMGSWMLTAALTVTATVALAVPAQAAEHDATQAALDQYLTHAGPGAAVHAGDGTESWTLTSGTAEILTNRPISPADHFRAASQTKTFVAVVVGQLVDEGLVDLDAPIEQYLPGVVTGPHYDGTVITVRQVLQHTSGIARDAVNPRANPDGTYALAELVRAGIAQPAQFPPGTSFGYSNVNYHLAALLVERITGQSYADAIESRIVGPLGLTGTTFPAPGDRTLPSPYLPGYRGLRVGPFFFWVESTSNLEVSVIAGAGDVISTLPDLVTFQRALADGDLVSAATLAEMRATVPVPGSELTYGLGLMHIELTCGGEAWGHAGDLTTGHSSLTMVTDDGRYASLVTNTFVTSTAEPTRLAVVDTALCEAAA